MKTPLSSAKLVCAEGLIFLLIIRLLIIRPFFFELPIMRRQNTVQFLDESEKLPMIVLHRYTRANLMDPITFGLVHGTEKYYSILDVGMFDVERCYREVGFI